ncbi:SDR family oxidoreductase [Lentisphaera profundi]|uniref:SDR family oxidoreductase n=1 Tax=Lentisphaera profundi TaxID=1658616 RepID=A0ABY7VVD8_9BACT|nr:SDR family oxidoreductase [Lentisphaera profundi]WDE98196.1 SDR family oxidoreductase [Lentisphaera profundi]
MKRTTDPQEIDFKSKFDLQDKVIIITGACGLIGRAFCEAAAQFGAHIVVADIEKANPTEFADSLTKRHNRTMLGVTVDVVDKSSVQQLLDITLKTFSKVNGLVNSHQNKTNSFFEKFEDYTEDNWDAVVETNLKGTFLSCQVIGTWMANHKGGKIVNIPSTYSVVAPNQNLYKGTNMGCPAAYSASKGGVDALSRYLASYWANKNIQVNMITPHGVWNKHEENFEENFSQFSPMERMSYNHEVASALIYLLSDASSYVTGDNMLVEGGWTVW